MKTPQHSLKDLNAMQQVIRQQAAHCMTKKNKYINRVITVYWSVGISHALCEALNIGRKGKGEVQ